MWSGIGKESSVGMLGFMRLGDLDVVFLARRCQLKSSGDCVNAETPAQCSGQHRLPCAAAEEFPACGACTCTLAMPASQHGRSTSGYQGLSSITTPAAGRSQLCCSALQGHDSGAAATQRSPAQLSGLLQRRVLGRPQLHRAVVRHRGDQAAAVWRHIGAHDAALVARQRARQLPVARRPQLGCAVVAGRQQHVAVARLKAHLQHTQQDVGHV